MYTGINPQSPLAVPGTIDPNGSLKTVNALPPPGRAVDLTVDLQPQATGHFPQAQHEIELVLGGTITAGETWTLTFTPTKTINGLPVADALGAVTISADVPANPNDNATGLGDAFVTAFQNASKVTTTAGVSALTRIGEILESIVNATGTLTAKGTIAGETYDVSYTTEAGGSVTPTVTVDASGVDMQIGIFAVKYGLAADGVTPLIRAPQAGDTVDMFFGIVADGGRNIQAIDAQAGYTARYYSRGADVPIIPIGGGHAEWTAISEGAVDFDDDVWVRIVATGSEIAGAVNDDPDFVGQLVTVTPTVANTTQYKGVVLVYGGAGELLASAYYDYTSDGTATDAEIVAGIQADLTGLASFVTVGGTTTLTLEALGPDYTIVYNPSGAGIEDPAITEAGSTDHVKLPIKFSRTTTAAGPAAIQF